jgi:type IV pilus assembly protein PilE
LSFNMAMPPKCEGLTLIELMVVLAIIGVLSALAYPSYQQHLRRSERLAAMGALLEAQLVMERHYAALYRYTQDAGGQVAPVLPARLQTTPAEGSARYRLSVQASLEAYTLSATPVLAGVACDSFTLTLTQTGVKGAVAEGIAVDADTAAQCWQ